MRINSTNSLWDWYLRQHSNSRNILKNNSIDSKATSNVNNAVRWDRSEISKNEVFTQIKYKLSRFESIEPATFEEFQHFARVEWGLHVDKDQYDYYTHNGRTREQAMNERAEVLEKWANGETLSKSERRKMSVFGGNSRDATNAGARRNLKFEYDRMNKLLEENGINFTNGETFDITLSSPGGKAVISGLENEEKRKKVEDIINSSLDKKLWVLYEDSVVSYMNIPQSERFMSRAVGMVENFLQKHTDGSISLKDLFMDKSGNILGLPDSLYEIINNKNPHFELRELKVSLNIVLPYIAQNSIDTLPRHSYYFRFGDGKLTTLDKYS